MKVFEVVTEDLQKTLEEFAASHPSPQGPAGGRCVTPTQPRCGNKWYITWGSNTVLTDIQYNLPDGKLNRWPCCEHHSYTGVADWVVHCSHPQACVVLWACRGVARNSGAWTQECFMGPYHTGPSVVLPVHRTRWSPKAPPANHFNYYR